MLRGFLSRLDSLDQQIAVVERRILDLVKAMEAVGTPGHHPGR